MDNEEPERPSAELDEMIGLHYSDNHEAYSFTSVTAAEAAAAVVVSSSEEEEEDRSKNARKRMRAQEVEYDTHSNATSPFKMLCGVLLVLLIVATITTVIGYSVWTTPHRHRQQPLLPLWTDHHLTTSAPVAMSRFSRGVMADVEQALGSHLLQFPRHYPCLCMHHLKYPWVPISESSRNNKLELALNEAASSLYQVCAIVGTAFDEVILLVNPQLQGRGNETDEYTEYSVSCKDNPSRRQRFRTIFLEWVDSSSSQLIWGRFDGSVAACLQLALDEMILGDKHCF
jgi:Polypeptide deformylase